MPSQSGGWIPTVVDRQEDTQTGAEESGRSGVVEWIPSGDSPSSTLTTGVIPCRGNYLMVCGKGDFRNSGNGGRRTLASLLGPHT